MRNLYFVLTIIVTLGFVTPELSAQGGRFRGEQSGKDQGEILNRMFNFLDKNSDGAISADEAPERLKSRMVQMDANKNGKIEMSEMKTAISARRGQGNNGQAEPGNGQKMTRDQGMPGGNQGQGRRGQAQQGGSDMAQLMFGRFDKDGNGSISKEEAPDRMKQGFDRLDSNADGRIDKKEFAAVVERMQQSQGQAGNGG
jgi:Ca2+-binding EF-hand superfamily protein